MTKEPSKHQLLVRSVFISGGLLCFKFTVFWFTNSLAILASMVDSLMDFMISSINLFLLQIAAKPADQDHPYGHGKIESLSGLVQSLIIGGVTLSVGVGAVQRFMKPQHIQDASLGVLVMAVALAFNIWHVRNLKKSLAATGSSLIGVEYLHYVSDTYVYLGVLAALGLTWLTGSLWWDPLVSMLIVLYLLKTVVGVFRNSLGELLDEQLPDAVLEQIRQIILTSHSRVIGYHDLRTRKVSETKFIEFHIELREVQRFDEAHEITEFLIEKVKAAFPGSVVTVHTDPEGER